jgi:hypothetical protein
VFDRGANLTSPRGRDMIASQVKSPEHQAAIAGGIAHFTGLPHIVVDGETAVDPPQRPFVLDAANRFGPSAIRN